MIEIGLALWIVAIGAFAMIPLAAVRMPLLYAATMVPAGYAIYVISSLVLTVAGRSPRSVPSPSPRRRPGRPAHR